MAQTPENILPVMDSKKIQDLPIGENGPHKKIQRLSGRGLLSLGQSVGDEVCSDTPTAITSASSLPQGSSEHHLSLLDASEQDPIPYDDSHGSADNLATTHFPSQEDLDLGDSFSRDFPSLDFNFGNQGTGTLEARVVFPYC